MLSACGRYVIAFNGGIYNHQEVRGRLERERAGVIAADAHPDRAARALKRSEELGLPSLGRAHVPGVA